MDLKVVVEYQRNIPELYKKIKEIVVSEISNMTNLEVVEVNVDVVDIKTKEQHEARLSKPARSSNWSCWINK